MFNTLNAVFYKAAFKVLQSWYVWRVSPLTIGLDLFYLFVLPSNLYWGEPGEAVKTILVPFGLKTGAIKAKYRLPSSLPWQSTYTFDSCNLSEVQLQPPWEVKMTEYGPFPLYRQMSFIENDLFPEFVQTA